MINFKVDLNLTIDGVNGKDEDCVFIFNFPLLFVLALLKPPWPLDAVTLLVILLDCRVRGCEQLLIGVVALQSGS